MATENEESEAVKLEKDIRSGERWLIGINATSVILSAVIALIYFGQLNEMRKATEASVKAANAATSAAKTSASQLELTERPWLSADITLNGPLSYNVNGANIPVIISLKIAGILQRCPPLYPPAYLSVLSRPQMQRTIANSFAKIRRRRSLRILSLDRLFSQAPANMCSPLMWV